RGSASNGLRLTPSRAARSISRRPLACRRARGPRMALPAPAVQARLPQRDLVLSCMRRSVGAPWSHAHMQAISLKAPASLENLKLIDTPAPGGPGPGEIKVCVHASSLNFHDFAVVAGMIASADGRIPMSDGAGDVVAVGAGVTEFAVGDKVVSTFFPEWLDGRPADSAFRAVPGDGVDGYAREFVVAKQTSFTHVPKGYTHAEAATVTCAGVTAWRALVVEGQLKAGDVVLTQGAGGVSVFALQIAKAMGATVVATSSSDEKLERLKSMGADYTINYKNDPKWG